MSGLGGLVKELHWEIFLNAKGLSNIFSQDSLKEVRLLLSTTFGNF